MSVSDLKAHKFFSGIDFDKIRTIKSPLIEKLMKMAEKPEITYGYDELEKSSQKSIVLTGLVQKMKYLLFYNTR